MQSPPSHPREGERLQSLRQLNLLETPIEERFERITRMARQMLDMPVAAISLVDEARQWFKSVQGLELCETHRKDSFCGHAVLGYGPFVVRDARKDERFADNPLVTGAPFIRFYAGHPIRSPAGEPVGTLCVVDRRPRRFGARQERLLMSLAQAAEVEVCQAPGDAQRELLAELDEAGRRVAVDSTTRLWGREAILDILEREFRRAHRRETGIGAVIVGLDQGEQLSLELGIEAGDEVLRKTARRLLRGVRPQDAVGRFGGQQFLGVVSRIDRSELAALAQQLRAKVAKTPVRGPKGQVNVTVSVGAAWAPASALRTPGPLLDAADDALCWAQLRGGNRVEVRAA